jgi:hypothetical protein
MMSGLIASIPDLVPRATIVYEEALAAVDAELAKGFNSFKNPLGDK